jgi:hypothetical protein
MEQSTSGEALKSSATKEIPRLWWNPKVYYSIRKSPPLGTTVNQINPVLASLPYLTPWRPILILSSHRHLGLVNGHLPWGSQIKTYVYVSCLSSTCPMLRTFVLQGSNLLTDLRHTSGAPSLHILHTPPIYVLRTDVRTHSYYFPVRHKGLELIAESQSVYCAVRAESLYIIQIILGP